MSAAYTEVEAGRQGLGLWGHEDPETAITRFRQHLERELAATQGALAALNAGDVRVYHQYGPIAARSRRLVHGTDRSPNTDPAG